MIDFEGERMAPASRIPGMRLEFANLHTDGEIFHERELLVRIVGDFTLWVRDELLYREMEFCLVELAVDLAAWLATATDIGSDFVYTPMESETEGLVRFTRFTPGSWRVSAADEQAAAQLKTEELRTAVLAYIRGLYAHLQPDLDLLKCIEDPGKLAAFRRALAP
jgi:hypothetical protein